MKNWPFWIGCLAAVIIIIVYLQFFRVEQPEPVSVPAPTPVAQPEKPEILHPIDKTATEDKAAEPIIDLAEPLPELQQSDEKMEDILSRLFAEQRLDRFFLLEHIIERFVVMVDNLPRQNLPVTHRPLKKIPGIFLATGDRENRKIAPANYKRYSPVITLLEKADSQQVVAVYVKLYPLFQEAYQGLGYPKAYFNDRLIEVIEHLLATPIVADPIRLMQPKALYHYADPELEALSAGRKILIRTGPENAERIKNILREYRKGLTAAKVND
ncbi:MAG: DUF3014 domain-containing protein [Desulfuromonadales bacterium]|nr:DUF3014 domain-containing protein [Desulfuromonadales bacterium]